MTIFNQILKGEQPAEKIYEDDKVLVIKDLYPVAPIHLLILPKKEFQDLHALTKDDLPLMGHIVSVAQQLAKEFGIEKGYRLTTNIGSLGGQAIFYLHFHLVGGRQLGPIA